MTQLFKYVVLLFLGAMAVGLLIAMASLLLYAMAFALLALVGAVVLAPNELKAFGSQFSGFVDRLLVRVEVLWHDIKVTLDQWGAREMTKAKLDPQETERERGTKDERRTEQTPDTTQ